MISKRLAKMLDKKTPRWAFYRSIEGFMFNSRGLKQLSLRKWNRSC